MIEERAQKESVFQTTVGELIVAIIDAATEVSSDAKEIEMLTHETLARLLNKKVVSDL